MPYWLHTPKAIGALMAHLRAPALVLACCLLLAACGDLAGDPDPAPPGVPGAAVPLDPEYAYPIAREITPPLSEILGDRWGLNEEDEFDGSPFATLGQDPSCDAIRARAVWVGENLDATVAGRAQRGYSDHESDDVFLDPAASVVVRVYRTVEEASAMSEAYRGIFEDPDFATCTAATAATDEDNPVPVTVSGPTSAPPASGSGVTIRVPDQGDNEVVVAEFYAWSLGNAFVEVVVGGSEHALDPTVAPRVLAATHERLTRRVSGEALQPPDEES